LVGWYHCEEVGIGLWITGGQPTGAATLGVSTGTAGLGLDSFWRLWLAPVCATQVLATREKKKCSNQKKIAEIMGM
jgi:hypothetical protein